ncbi:acyl-CoA Delta-9 desaturase-like [Schistocerca cancellata]|uniref:acyl-CoA Delta-9 desaturase-like n=1 Tax=Schistocerca cancellata TaxID=274614 RepID=UPI0021194F98|nr:acyl-CoA Delta-9 desaturase-like [Schistocerca cancellata]
MAPNITSTPTGVPYGNSILESKQMDLNEGEEKKPAPEYKRQIVWRNVLLFAYLHFAALYGAYLMFSSAKILTSIFAILMYQVSGLGITAGAHRLWSHRSYQARWPLRVLLMVFNTLAFQNHIFEWARDHRVHHKFTDTNADPHNATRGFFFSHVGWLMVRKHPDVMLKGKQIDLSDLERDSVVQFQKKYYLILMPVLCFLIPTCIPVYCWGETWKNAWFVATMFRYTLTLNISWLVNSAAHMWGNKPYDKFINPAENLSVAVLALGEGWHNYHHVFPWDYKTAELGTYSTNFTTAFIDFMARIGWAYDLKTVPLEMVKRRAQRTGDGTHSSAAEQNHGHGHSHEGGVWGWGDRDIPAEDTELITGVQESAEPSLTAETTVTSALLDGEAVPEEEEKDDEVDEAAAATVTETTDGVKEKCC